MASVWIPKTVAPDRRFGQKKALTRSPGRCAVQQTHAARASWKITLDFHQATVQAEQSNPHQAKTITYFLKTRDLASKRPLRSQRSSRMLKIQLVRLYHAGSWIVTWYEDGSCSLIIRQITGILVNLVHRINSISMQALRRSYGKTVKKYLISFGGPI